jgi:hypothetical protein
VQPGRHAKTSLYIGCCKNAREAAVAHDLAVVWWRVGTDYATLWQQHEAAAAAAAAAAGTAGTAVEQQQQQSMEVEGEEQHTADDGAGDGGSDGGGAGGYGGDGATLPPHLLPETIELQADTSILKQLNFPPAM